jgi:hypothetical protein
VFIGGCESRRRHGDACAVTPRGFVFRHPGAALADARFEASEALL